MITVEIVYAAAERQLTQHLQLPDTATVADALDAAEGEIAQMDLRALGVGVYGTQVARDHKLEDGDRVELYRPLLVDAKEARRRRAQRQREASERS